MADAIDVVADVLSLVRERDEAREGRDVSQREADAVLAAMREAARQVEMLRAERDKAIEERDLAVRGFNARRECESEAWRERNKARDERDVLVAEIEDVRAALGSLPLVGQHLAEAVRAVIADRDAILAKLEEAHAALKVVREWNDFERNGLREMRDQVRALVGGDENKPVVDAVRAVVEDRNAIRAELDRAQALYAASTTELANLRSRIVEHETAARAVGARAERERLRAIAADITAPEDAVSFIEDLKRGDL